MTARIGDVTLGDRPRVVAAGADAELDALAAADGADLVEIRADLFDDPTPDRVVDALGRVRRGGRPIILTVRRADEGGRALPDAHRRALYAAGMPLAAAVDVEIASSGILAALRPALAEHRCGLILSVHHVDRTPPVDVLTGDVDRGRVLGADVVKVATRTDTMDDLRTLLAATLACRDACVATLGMGRRGPLSRIVLPAAGSALVYASVGRPTAPGQLALGEVASMLDRLYEGS